MVISIRLDDKDMMLLTEIKFFLDKSYEELCIMDHTTNSEAIRSCIRYTYHKLIESNKSDT